VDPPTFNGNAKEWPTFNKLGYLRACLKGFCQEDSILAETIRDDFYVDDLITGGDTVNEYYDLNGN